MGNFLVFKHKIKKEIIEENRVLVKCPYNLLKGLFCNIGQELFLNLKEGTNLKIFIKKDKKVEFIWNKEIDTTIYKNLKKLAQHLKDIATIKVSEKSLTIQF